MSSASLNYHFASSLPAWCSDSNSKTVKLFDMNGRIFTKDQDALLKIKVINEENAIKHSLVVSRCNSVLIPFQNV